MLCLLLKGLFKTTKKFKKITIPWRKCIFGGQDPNFFHTFPSKKIPEGHVTPKIIFSEKASKTAQNSVKMI